MDVVALARALHVLAVVLWIGGVAMVTLVILPAVRARALGTDLFPAFHAIERRFVWIARAAIVIVGATGFYLTAELDLWSRFQDAVFWWMHAMLGVWLLFALILFFAEPLIIHRRFKAWAAMQPDKAFAWFHRAHWILLLLGVMTILGAVAGSHGGSLF